MSTIYDCRLSLLSINVDTANSSSSGATVRTDDETVEVKQEPILDMEGSECDTEPKQDGDTSVEVSRSGTVNIRINFNFN